MESENVDYIGNHPNWAALASVHIPYKRFIKSSNISDTVTDDPPKTKPINKFTTKLSGEEARKLYETITYESSDTSSMSSKTEKYQIADSKTNLKTEKRESCNKKIDFDKNKFFRAATHNDLITLKSFKYKDDLINSSDHYGWSALMMASCENSSDAVKFLLHEGANRNVKDKQGNTALSLAETKGYTEIIDLLQHFKVEQQFKKIKKESHKTFKHFCTICDKEFTVCKIKEHETSTVHLFNIKNENKKSFRYGAIPNSNRGLKLMIQQGWDRESGLGPKGTGNLFPIKTVLRKNRTGLGIEQDSAKVTHFKPYDTNAIKYKEPLKTKSRNEMRKEKLRNQKIERRLRKELS